MRFLNFCRARNCTESHVQEAYAKGREKGREDYRVAHEEEIQYFNKRQERHREEIKLDWAKLREEKRIFEEYKATEFFKMCREMNWKVGP